MASSGGEEKAVVVDRRCEWLAAAEEEAQRAATGEARRPKRTDAKAALLTGGLILPIGAVVVAGERRLSRGQVSVWCGLRSNSGLLGLQWAMDEAQVSHGGWIRLIHER